MLLRIIWYYHLHTFQGMGTALLGSGYYNSSTHTVCITFVCFSMRSFQNVQSVLMVFSGYRSPSTITWQHKMCEQLKMVTEFLVLEFLQVQSSEIKKKINCPASGCYG